MQTQLPPPPQCILLWRGDKCDQARQAYNQLVLQRAKEQGAKEASDQGERQLEYMRTEKNTEIQNLQQQIETLSREKAILILKTQVQPVQAFQEANAAFDRGVIQGGEIGIGISLVVYIVLRLLLRQFKSKAASV